MRISHFAYVSPLWGLSYFGELLSHLTSYAEPSDAEPSDAEPTEAKNKLGYKIRTLFKNCNCAAGQELSGNHLFPFFPVKTLIRHMISSRY